MKTIKLALPLLVATILSGCGSETVIEPRYDNALKDAKLLIIQKSENSLFNDGSLQKLMDTFYINPSSDITMIEKDGTNVHVGHIKDYKSRIDYIKGLGLSKDIESEIVDQLDTILQYHTQRLGFESNITSDMLWAAYAVRHPEYVSDLRRAKELKAEYHAYLKPFIEAADLAEKDKDNTRAAYDDEKAKVINEMFEYVIANKIPMSRARLDIGITSRLYKPVDGKCTVEEHDTGVPMQTIYNESDKYCHYMLFQNRTNRGLTDEQRQDLNNIVVGMNENLSKTFMVSSNANVASGKANKVVKNQEIAAADKYEHIQDYKWIQKARRFSELTNGYFNAATYDWREPHEKGFSSSAYQVAKHQNIDFSFPYLRKSLQDRELYLVYSNLLQNELDNAVVHDSVGSDGDTDLAKDEYINEFKILVSESRTMVELLKESEGKDGLRILKTYSTEDMLAYAPLNKSGLDYQKARTLKNAIDYCASSNGKESCML
ncbi:hypothetical protein LMH73_018340 [Vibrio splendidus]|nr:hypothetical protein [Vibrio splendidus]MCC4880724.1 hypothetical protein [Vibrio splendidus]